MKNIIRILIALTLIFPGAHGYAKETIKIAIVDNFKYQKFVTTKYKEYYLKGLTLALEQAKNDGILTTYKIFQYNQEPLSIVNRIPDVIKWNPDVIIGPRDSNKFLMLPPYIKDVPYIPILNFTKDQMSDLVFIDNDDLMRTVWSLAAEEAGLNISTYSSPSEFNNEINKYQKDTLIYIDSDLDDNVKGEEYAKHLYDLGFTELFLATGYPPEHFTGFPWIKFIVSKEPPFINKLESFQQSEKDQRIIRKRSFC
jgi:hypothetical protein